MNGFKNKVLLCMGDYRQIAPIVKHGSFDEIIAASMMKSPHWPKFEKHRFTVPLRLQGLNSATDGMSPVQLANLQAQKNFREVQLAIGNGNEFNDNVVFLSSNEKTCKTNVALPTMTTTQEDADVIRFLYPNGFDTSTMPGKAILAGNFRILRISSISHF